MITVFMCQLRRCTDDGANPLHKSCAVGAAAAWRDNASAFNRITMDTPRLRIGRAITPEQFELLSDEQLARLLPRAVREFFPGKDFCADGSFYLHDGTAWSFFKGGYVDE
jgi:hypothetical protein